MTRSMWSRVAVVVGEGAELGGHFGRGGIGDAGHDRGERAGRWRGLRRES